MVEIIGIDLGTTKSAVAIWLDGAPHIIPDSQGRTIMPSVVAIDPTGRYWSVGHEAREIAANHPQNAVYSIKRFIGRRFQEEVVQTTLQKLYIPYDLHESQRHRDRVEVCLGEKRITPQEISAKILQRLKANAEAYLGHEVTQAVITVPAYFNDAQRQATRDAGLIAGLNVRAIVSEPTAACLAFGYHKLDQERRVVAVYDLGGGTFDISIVEIGRGPFSVRAINGDTFLGGDDLNQLIVAWILDQMEQEDRKLVEHDPIALATLRKAAEQAKQELSSAEETTIDLPSPLSPNASRTMVKMVLTRSQLVDIAEPWIKQTLNLCAQALHDAKVRTGNVHEVLLVGGQTRMPAIREAVGHFFGAMPNTSLHPEEVVALGAAVRGAILAGIAGKLKLADVVPLSLGVASRGHMDVFISRNARSPISVKKSYTTFHDNQVEADIEIYQGEKPKAADNIRLGVIQLRGLMPAAAGEPEIEITFDVDEDGILHVTTEDRETGIKKGLTITEHVRLNEDEIKDMIKDAEEHKVEYAEERRQAELRYQAEDLSKKLKKILSDSNRELHPELQSQVEAAVIMPVLDDWEPHLMRLQELWRDIHKVPGIS